MRFNYVMCKIRIYTSHDVDCVCITHFSCLILLRNIFFPSNNTEIYKKPMWANSRPFYLKSGHMYTVVTPRQTRLYQARFRLYAVQCMND